MKWLYYDKEDKNLQNKKKGRFRYRAAVGESNMDFSGLFSMQGMLFTIMILGYLFRKTGMITDAGKGLLTDLVLFVTLPASIIKSFEIEFNHQILLSCLVIIIVATAIQAGAWLLGRILYPGFPDERKKVLQYATICSNAGILGNSIAEGVFGGLGLLYASIYTIPQRTFMWSIGLTYFTQAPDAKSLIKKVCTHPCIVSVFAGLLIMILQIQLPGFLSLTIKNIAGGNTFLAMMLVGTILGGSAAAFSTGTGYDLLQLYPSGLIPFLVFAAMPPGPCGQSCYRRFRGSCPVCRLPVLLLYLLQSMIRMKFLQPSVLFFLRCFPWLQYRSGAWFWHDRATTLYIIIHV